MIKGKEHGIGELDEHFRNRIDVYADKHPTLLVRQLAERLRKEWNKIEEPEQEPVELEDVIKQIHDKCYQTSFDSAPVIAVRDALTIFRNYLKSKRDIL